MHEHQQLPSGKQVMKLFDAEGRVASESHAYGMLDIGITMEFSEGVKTGEMYFVNKRLVSRKRSEKARVEYSDMPPPESNLEDIGGELAKAVQSDRRQRSKAAKEHVPDSEAAMRIDSFCQSILSTGMQADAKAWIEFTKHTLGEYSHTRSRTIIKKLLRLGAKQVHVCDIDSYDGDHENTGHLVVELPDDPDTRKPVFAEIDRLASSQGFEEHFDEGQRYAYIKLD